LFNHPDRINIFLNCRYDLQLFFIVFVLPIFKENQHIVFELDEWLALKIFKVEKVI